MDLKRRDFMKVSGLAVSALLADWIVPSRALGAVSASVGEEAAAAPAAVTPGSAVSLEECLDLDHRDMAARSSMVQAAWDYLQEEAGAIRDPAVRRLVQDIYGDSTPRLAALDGGRRKQVWVALSGAGYTTAAKDDFLPGLPADMRERYPAVSAPGSGYGSHHAYPGGLITHVATNVRITAAIVDAYNQVYGYGVDQDIAMASQLLHDLHKPYVFQWHGDGSSRTEQPLAGTGEHHVLSLAELMVREAPAELVVAQACAHTHPGTDADEAQVVNWLKAAAIIADRDPVEYGVLAASGATLPLPRRQEGFICHLGDHDFVLSVPAVQWTLPLMCEVAAADYRLTADDMAGKRFNALRNMVYSQTSAMAVHHASIQGRDALRSLMHSVVEPV